MMRSAREKVSGATRACLYRATALSNVVRSTLPAISIASPSITVRHFRTCTPSCNPNTQPRPIDANPLLSTDSPLPQFSLLNAADIRRGCAHLLEELELQFTELEQKLATEIDSNAQALSYQQVVHALERVTDRLSYVWGIVSHLSSVKDSADLRAAIDELEPKRLQLALKFAQSTTIIKALKAIEASKKLNEVEAKVVHDMLLEARLAGSDLIGVERDRFNAIAQKLAKLSTQFSHNILDASSKGASLTVTDPSVMKNIPLTVRGLYAAHARDSAPNIPNATAEEGPWRIGLNAAHYLPFMTYCTSRSHRELLYRMYTTRASKYDGFNNKPILAEILYLKHLQANLLGFSNYAEMSLATKMVDSPSAVEKFLEELRVVARPHALTDMDDLLKFTHEQKNEHAFPVNQQLKSWDVGLYAELLQASPKYNFDGEKLRPYLSFPRVLTGLWSLVESLFNVRIVERTKERQSQLGHVDVWNSDVLFFDVFESDPSDASKEEQLIAGFFVDPYSRPAEKRGGAWMNECVTRARIQKPDGKTEIRLPIAYLICNQQPPAPDGSAPSLMNLNELLTLFHETGHVLQHILTRVDECSVSGIRGVEWDSVELASQFMENFCYELPILNRFAQHYKSGAPIEKSLVDGMIKAKNFRAGSGLLRQLHFSILDMKLHMGSLGGLPQNKAHIAQAPLEASPQTLTQIIDSIERIEQQMSPLTSVMEYDPQNQFLCSFSHIFAGGYSAGYYSYKYAEVMSADAYEAFLEADRQHSSDPKLVEAKRAELGKRYRDTVLALGGSKKAAEVFRMFRGRDPSPQSLLNQTFPPSAN